jgi:hypothetical protein
MEWVETFQTVSSSTSAVLSAAAVLITSATAFCRAISDIKKIQPTESFL